MKERKRERSEAQKKTTPKPVSARTETGLTMQQRRFVLEFAKDLNATAAAIRAGYSEKSADVQGVALMRNPKVVRLLEAHQEDKQAAAWVTVERVLRELGIIGFSDLRNYVLDQTGNISLAEGVPDQAMRAVQSIKRKSRVLPGGTVDKPAPTEYEVEIKLWEKTKALEMIGKHLQMFVDRLEVTGKDGKELAGYTDEGLARTLAVLDAARARRDQS